MQTAKHNSKFQWVKNPSISYKGLTTLLIVSLISSSYAWADNNSLRDAVANTGSVQGLMGAIENLNQAMRVAAVNPMDDWRRDEVRKAMSALPAAYSTLAGTFSSNVLGNSSLPLVQSMAAAAVDQEAPLSFEKFLKEPPKAVTSSLEKDFSSAQTLVAVDNSSLIPQGLPAPVKPSEVASQRADVANLNAAQSVQTVEPQQTISKDIFTSHKVANASAAENTVVQLGNDVATVEANLKSREIASSANENISSASAVSRENEEAKSDSFEKQSKSIKTRSKRKVSNTLRKPTSWLLAPAFYLADWAISGQDALANNQNPTGESGGGAGEFLFGVAAVMSAVAPMVVASQQANAQKQQAQIQANAQIQQTQIQTQTSKDLAQMSAQTAMAQADVQRQVAQMNNDAQTQRQQMTMAAAQAQRDAERQDKIDQQNYQRQIQAQQLAIADRQANESIRIAQQNLEAQKLQMALGLSDGSNQQTGRTIQSMNTAAQSASPLVSALGLQNTDSQDAQSASAANGQNFTGRRLLAAVDSSVDDLAKNLGASQNPSSLFPGNTIPNSRPRALKTARGLYRSGISPIAAGSFIGQRNINSLTSMSDLAQFGSEVPAQPASDNSFAHDRNLRIQELGNAAHGFTGSR